MNNKLYVGNLAFSVTEEQLTELFSQYGTVQSVKVIKDESGRSKGFGFIEMGSDDEAANALRNLNGKDVSGRAIKVDVTREKSFAPRGDRGGQQGGGFRRF